MGRGDGVGRGGGGLRGVLGKRMGWEEGLGQREVWLEGAGG